MVSFDRAESRVEIWLTQVNDCCNATRPTSLLKFFRLRNLADKCEKSSYRSFLLFLGYNNKKEI